MTKEDYSKVLCEKIIELRKRSNMTQEALATRLGITFQAVSKWENAVSCPDIVLLPELAEIFGVSIDELFGKQPVAASQAVPSPYQDGNISGQPASDDGKAEQSGSAGTVPWPDDGKLRVVVYLGRQLTESCDSNLGDIEFHYDGEALNVESRCSITCDNIQGNAKAGVNIQCDNIEGSATAGCDIHCDNIEGSATAGCDINCDVISGDANAGADINCDTIEGDVVCKGNVS
ncbi:MAG: helix-turn-helix transcriptional regulator [Saccharofermentanales bacterium]